VMVAIPTEMKSIPAQKSLGPLMNDMNPSRADVMVTGSSHPNVTRHDTRFLVVR